MKIKITESQYSKIKLLVEGQDYLEAFRSLCANKAKEVDSVYSRVINESIGDLLGMSINAYDINNALDKIETQIFKAEKNIIDMWEGGLIQDDDESFENIVKDIADSVTGKITSLTLILNSIEKLQNYEEENELTKQFTNIKPIQIQSFGSENP